MPTAAQLRDALRRVPAKRSVVSHLARPGARSYLGPGLTPDRVDIRKVVTPDEVAAVVGPVFPGYTHPPLHEPPVHLSQDLPYRWFIFLVQGGGDLTVSLREAPLDVARYPVFFEETNVKQPGRFVRVAHVGDDAYFDREQGHLAVRVDRVEIAFHPRVLQPPSTRALVQLAQTGVARLRQEAR
jgi:hypothetical protein